MEQYEKPKNDESNNVQSFRIIVCKLFNRCLMTYNYIGVVNEIFRDFKKHKTAYQTLAELGIYMNKPGFNVERTQSLMDFFIKHG